MVRAASIDSGTALPVKRLVDVAKFGLGNRLIRATAAWHLAELLNVTDEIPSGDMWPGKQFFYHFRP